MNLVDIYHDIAGYIRGAWAVTVRLPKARYYADANDMSVKSFLTIAYRVKKNNYNIGDLETAECGQCYRIPGGEKLRLMGWRCPEHGLAHFDEGEG